VVVIGYGTVGYMLVENWSFSDAIYMSVITVATIGYGETHPLHTDGRIFTMTLIFVGIGTFTYTLSEIAAFVVESQLTDFWGKRRMERRLTALKNHIVICGGGDSALHIAHELRETKTPFVIVEFDPSQETRLKRFDEDILYVIGDASDTDVLSQARVETAAGLISCLPTDKDNLFTVIEARDLNPTMRIVTRVFNEESRIKLSRAGADAIVSSQRIGALRLASEMLRPHVVSFLDVMLRETRPIRVAEIPIGPGVVGKTLASLRMQERAGVIPFGLQEGTTKELIYNPLPTRILREGDVLIACADPDELAKARAVATSG
jgi:voltage-gated potassium channel